MKGGSFFGSFIDWLLVVVAAHGPIDGGHYHLVNIIVVLRVDALVKIL
jgi:hypothetical protein